MNTFLPLKLMRLKGEPLTEQTPSSTLRCISPWPLRARWAFTSLLLVVAACGGGGGGGSDTSGAPKSTTGGTTTGGAATGGNLTGGTTTAGTTTTTTTTVVVTDKDANAQALAGMSGTPVNVAVWGQLNSAGADIIRSMLPVTETVFISTFKTIANPTGGLGTIKVFDALVASGALNSSRVFQLSTGALPTGTTAIWVNVNGEDFTRNNPDAESALETSVTNLGSALPAPLP